MPAVISQILEHEGDPLNNRSRALVVTRDGTNFILVNYQPHTSYGAYHWKLDPSRSYPSEIAELMEPLKLSSDGGAFIVVRVQLGKSLTIGLGYPYSESLCADPVVYRNITQIQPYSP